MRTLATILSACAAIVCVLALGTKADARGALSGEQAAWLTAHNEAREAFGTAPLKWSDKLTEDAKQWADRLARENTIRHSRQDTRGRTGENLWMGTSGYFKAAQMIGFFVDEQQYFRSGRFPDVSRTGNWADVGHYTQIVWADTREVGCAKASNSQNDVLVCRYYPGGNVLGKVIAPQRKVARR